MKNFHLSESYVILNFDAINCQTSSEVLTSRSFFLVITKFYKHLRDSGSVLLSKLRGVSSEDIVDLYKHLLMYSIEEAVNFNKKIETKHLETLYAFTEEFYDYWRKFTRFGFLKGSKNYDPNIKVSDLINYGSNFNEIIITLYRKISQKLLKSHFHVFRQLPAGINANMLYAIHRFSDDSNYANLRNMPFVTKIVTTPPFIINSKANTRTGTYEEIDHNPLKSLKFNKNHFIAFPIYVGPLLAFVYIHRDYLHHGIALSNLFEFANYVDFKDKKPDLVYVYGIKEEEYNLKFHHDLANDIYLGFVTQAEKNDYFGYLKKMLLTLHNVCMINKGMLPIHGAMVKLLLNNGKIKTICIIGDSGAGKSESLEALRQVGKAYIKRMDVVFDDMGTFKLVNNKVVANGTEIGAFVRLDDLDTGYAYEIMDRALFLNPHKVNARVVIPISSYKFILENHQVDLLLYANNYDKEYEGIKLFNNLEEALETFKEGARIAKGTTSETGLVKTFFANPFGPVQLSSKTNQLIKKYFNKLNDNGTKIGEIYTKLAVNGKESTGPNEAALSLLKYITENK